VLAVRVGRRSRPSGSTAALHGLIDSGLDGHTGHLVVGVPALPAESDRQLNTPLGFSPATAAPLGLPPLLAPPSSPTTPASPPPVLFAPPSLPASSPLVAPVPHAPARLVAPAPVAPDRDPDTDATATAKQAEPDGLLPGAQTFNRKLRFAAVNACTLASLMLGLAAIFLSMHAEVRVAALCLVGCVTFDGLDGALARRLGVSSPFGAQMDSLADMCSFGVAAPVVVYAALHHSAPAALVAGACALVSACAAIRLARFNVSPKDGRFFCGVPTTMAAAVLSLAALIGLQLPGAVAVIAISLLAFAMVSSFPYAKLARILRLPRWMLLVPVVGAFLDYRITFAALVVLYLASGPLLWLRQRQRVRAEST
jgi:CDP-diacylglycerol--serine O-phosphatidyltransferase